MVKEEKQKVSIDKLTKSNEFDSKEYYCEHESQLDEHRLQPILNSDKRQGFVLSRPGHRSRRKNHI